MVYSMTRLEAEVAFAEGALSRLLSMELVRALIDPDADVGPSGNLAIRRAEFWSVIDAVRTEQGRVFPSREAADAALFDHLSGGGFGIRLSLRDAVLSLLEPVGKSQMTSEDPVVSDPQPARIRVLDPGVIAHVSEQLGNYVYMLVDPRDSRPFYVGKGVGLRMMSHGLEAVEATAESGGRRVQRINEIRAAGLEHEIWIVRYGLSRTEYTSVEAAVIDILGSFPILPTSAPYRPLEHRDEITNLRREDAKGKGMILLDRLVDDLAAPPLTTSTPLLLITLSEWTDEEIKVAGNRVRHGNGFKREWYEPRVRDASIDELELSTTAWWKLSRRSVESRGIHHAVAVHRGVTRALFEIDSSSWTSSHGRTAFVGVPVLSGDLYDEVIGPHGHRVAPKSQGSQNPIGYWPRPQPPAVEPDGSSV